MTLLNAGRLQPLVWLIAVPIFVSACGGGGDESAENTLNLDDLVVRGMSGDAASEANPWLVAIRSFRLDSITPGTGDVSVRTLQYNATRTLQQHIDFYDEQVELDTCEVYSDNGTGGSAGSGSSSPPYVTAGTSVTINAPDGTWFTVQEIAAGRYEVDNELPEAIPDGATVSIPGAVFPSVGAIPLSEPAVPVRLLPEFGAVNAAAEYSWLPGDGTPGQFMQLDFLEYDDANNFIDFRIGCDLIDDGSFELPVDVRFAISNNSNFLVPRYTRRVRSLDVVEGVVVFSNNGVAE